VANKQSGDRFEPRDNERSVHASDANSADPSQPTAP
jgi:hypothetical protein